MSDFGTRLRLIRVEQGMTIQEMANALGLSYTTVHKYELGERRPSAVRAVEIAEKLGVPAGWLRGEGETFAWEVAE